MKRLMWCCSSFSPGHWSSVPTYIISEESKLKGAPCGQDPKRINAFCCVSHLDKMDCRSSAIIACWLLSLSEYLYMIIFAWNNHIVSLYCQWFKFCWMLCVFYCVSVHNTTHYSVSLVCCIVYSVLSVCCICALCIFCVSYLCMFQLKFSVLCKQCCLTHCHLLSLPNVWNFKRLELQKAKH